MRRLFCLTRMRSTPRISIWFCSKTLNHLVFCNSQNLQKLWFYDRGGQQPKRRNPCPERSGRTDSWKRTIPPKSKRLVAMIFCYLSVLPYSVMQVSYDINLQNSYWSKIILLLISKSCLFRRMLHNSATVGTGYIIIFVIIIRWSTIVVTLCWKGWLLLICFWWWLLTNIVLTRTKWTNFFQQLNTFPTLSVHSVYPLQSKHNCPQSVD